MSTPSFTLARALQHGGGFLANVTPYVSEWRGSKRRLGGCWLGSGRLSAPTSILLDFFYNQLGNQWVVTSDGLEGWRGIIHEMTLQVGKQTYRRSLLRTANAIKAMYALVGINLVDNPSAETGTTQVYPLNGPSDWGHSMDWATSGQWSFWFETDAILQGLKWACTTPVVAGASYVASVDINIVSEWPDDWVTLNVVLPGGQAASIDTEHGAHGPQTLKVEFVAEADGGVELQVYSEQDMFVRVDNVQITPARLPADTGWITRDDSIIYVGRMEEVLLEAEHTMESAAALVNTELGLRGIPDPEIVEIRDTAVDEPALEFYTCGLVYSLAWKYAQHGGEAAVSTHIADFLAESLYLQAGRIAANTMTYKVDLSYPIRQWDAVNACLRAGDVTGQPWRGGCWVGKRFDYEPVESDPGVYHDAQGWHRLDGSLVDPFLFEPGRALCGDLVGLLGASDQAVIEQVEVDLDGNISVQLEDG